MLGLIYAHKQLSMHLRDYVRQTELSFSLFYPNNRWIIAQIVLIWSETIKSGFWNPGNILRWHRTWVRWNKAK